MSTDSDEAMNPSNEDHFWLDVSRPSIDVIQGNSEDDIYTAPLEREDIVSSAQ